MADTEGFRNDWATKDFYRVLGVAKDASAADIKTAYRKLARANHPDSNPGDDKKHETFKAVAEAYDVVGDEAKRAKYDEFRSLQSRGGFGPGMGGGGGGGFGGGGFNIDDLLRERGGGRRPRRHVRRPLRRRRRRSARAPSRRARVAAPTSRARRRSGSPTPSTASRSRCG